MAQGATSRWTQTAVASALLLGLAGHARAGDLGSFFGGVVGGIIGSQIQQPTYQQPRYYQPQPQYYQEQPQYSGTSEARREYLARQAEIKKQKAAAAQKAKDEQAAQQAAAAQQATAPGGTIDITMKRKDGNLWVPVQINKSVTIDFVIDSGASDITIPKDVYQTLVRSGTLTSADFVGTAQYGIADGTEVKGSKFKLSSIQVGNQQLTGVVASVMPSDSATPLLGLSFLSRFKSWTIDNNTGTLRLVLNDGATQVASAAPAPQAGIQTVPPAPTAQPAPAQQVAAVPAPQVAVAPAPQVAPQVAVAPAPQVAVAPAPQVAPAPAPQVVVIQQPSVPVVPSAPPSAMPKQVADAGPHTALDEGAHPHAVRGGGDRALMATESPQPAPQLPSEMQTAAVPAAPVPPAAPAPAPAATPAATTAVAAPGMPVFPANTAYADARHSLMALGFGPAPLPDRETCDKDTDLTCFPEREACKKADGIQCEYFWKKGEQLIKVKTVAVPPTVAAVECQVNCNN